MTLQQWLVGPNHLDATQWLQLFSHFVVMSMLSIGGAIAVAPEMQRFIVGDRLTIADLSLAGYVFYPKEELGFDISAEYPNLSAWMRRIAQTPGWQAPYELLG